MMTLFIY